MPQHIRVCIHHERPIYLFHAVRLGQRVPLRAIHCSWRDREDPW